MPQIIGNKIIELNSVDSTNKYANEMISARNTQDIIAGTVIWALEQFAGKGQQDTIWISEPQKNLTFSIILFPTFLNPGYLFLLNETIALGIYDFVKSIIKTDASMCSDKVKIKWPNDIYVEVPLQPIQKGGKLKENKKIAGILIENAIVESKVASSVIGVGLNINQEKFPCADWNIKPTSLKLITGKTYDLRACLKELLRAIDKRYRNIVASCPVLAKHAPSVREFEKIKNDYLEVLLGFKEERRYREVRTQKIFTAQIIDVNETGELVLQKEGIENMEEREVKYNFKEVEFVF